MTKIDKLKKRFLGNPKDFKWNELAVLLHSFGYIEYTPVKQVTLGLDLYILNMVIL